MPIYEWDWDREEILNRLRSSATLKLCVKLLDEPFQIEHWIKHHAGIVGFENLIVADNGSTDPATLSTYAKFGDAVTIFRFNGSHNEIHWHPRFADLFGVIKETCRHFAFVDADERLVLIDGDTWTADASIVERITSSEPRGIIPTTWLINRLNSLDTFDLLDTEARPQLRNNLKWGKPLLPADLAGIQPGMHNVQFSHFPFSTEFGVSFFLLHYTQFPESRISVNRNKLMSRGAIDKAMSIQEIALLDFSTHPDQTLVRFVNEIKEMLSISPAANGNTTRRTDDCIRLEPDGRISYSNEHARAALSEFLASASESINAIFGHEPEEEKLHGASAKSLLAFALQLRQQGEGARAERLLYRGIALYPDFRDQYGDPAFRKELVRTFLARREWSKAAELCPQKDQPRICWHYVLFARAFSQVGDDELAAKWWKLVLEHDPHNQEAKAFLGDAVGCNDRAAP